MSEPGSVGEPTGLPPPGGAARFVQALDAMPTAWLTLGRDGRIIFANTEARGIFGLPVSSGSPEHAGDQTLWEILPRATGAAFEARCRRALDSGLPVGFEIRLPEPHGVWLEVRAWPDGVGLSLVLLDVTARLEAERVAQQDAEQLRLLAWLSDALASTMDAVEAMRLLADLVVPAFADWCIITLVDDDGLHDAGLAHRDPARLDDVRAYAAAQGAQRIETAPFWRVLHGGEPYHVPTIVPERVAAALPDPATRELLARLGPTSGTGVPLTARGRSVGVLSLWNTGSRPAHTPTEIETAVELGRRAGLAVDNAQLYARQRRMAEALQRSLLTDPAPLPGLEIAVRYRPAAEEARIGGDWYDAFLTSRGAARIVIGDVAGHDREAAAMMGQTRNLLRGIAYGSDDEPESVLTSLDHAMRDLTAGSLATAVLAAVGPVDPAVPQGELELRWSNAGHPPPILIDAAGAVEMLDTEPDLLLGLDPDAPRSGHSRLLAAGTTVLLYTDGLVERRNASLSEGFGWLIGALRDAASSAPDALCDSLLDAVGPRLDDDVALLAFRFTGSSEEPSGISS